MNTLYEYTDLRQLIWINLDAGGEIQRLKKVVGGARFELATNGLKVRCSTD